MKKESPNKREPPKNRKIFHITKDTKKTLGMTHI